MKKNLIKVIAVTAVVSLTANQNVSAQDNAAAIVNAGAGTVNSLANAYMSPLMKSLGVGLTDGWNNNTAKVLGVGGFDFRMNLGVAMVPTEDQSYKVADVFKNNPNMTWTNNGVPSTAPTIFGSSTPVPGTMDGSSPVTIGGTTTNVPVVNMQLPAGSGSATTASLPSAQLSFGIPKNTEVMVRFIPTMNAGSVSVGTWGLGVKHDLKQWVPAIKEMPLWDWSGIAAFSSFNADYAFGTSSLQPTFYPSSSIADNGTDPNLNGVDYNNQKITISGTGFTLGTVVSAKLLFFTPYLGLNYSRSSMNMKFEGNYPIVVPNEGYNPTPGPGQNLYTTKVANLANPIDIDGTVSSMRLNMGARIKVLVLVIGAEYSIGAYNTATISVGLNLQSIVPFSM